MKLSKIVLSLTVVFTFVACATHAQDNRSFNYNAMSKAQSISMQRHVQRMQKLL